MIENGIRPRKYSSYIVAVIGAVGVTALFWGIPKIGPGGATENPDVSPSNTPPASAPPRLGNTTVTVACDGFLERPFAGKVRPVKGNDNAAAVSLGCRESGHWAGAKQIVHGTIPDNKFFDNTREFKIDYVLDAEGSADLDFVERRAKDRSGHTVSYRELIFKGIEHRSTVQITERN